MDKVVNGQKISEEIISDSIKKIAELKSKGIIPKIASIYSNTNPSVIKYVSKQKSLCSRTGIELVTLEFTEKVTEKKLEEHILKLNEDKSITGIVLNLPIGSDVDSLKLQEKIDYKKDIEGVTPFNMGHLLYTKPLIVPCTAQSAVEILNRILPDLKGVEICVVGKSQIVGKPIIALLMQSPDEAPTLSICHIATKDTAFHTRTADVVIVCVGKPNFLKSDMIKDGAVIIDIGINVVDGKIVGDVDFNDVYEKCSYITPVPGGVGALTGAMLIRNCIKCALLQKEIG